MQRSKFNNCPIVLSTLGLVARRMLVAALIVTILATSTLRTAAAAPDSWNYLFSPNGKVLFNGYGHYCVIDQYNRVFAVDQNAHWYPYPPAQCIYTYETFSAWNPYMSVYWRDIEFRFAPRGYGNTMPRGNLGALTGMIDTSARFSNLTQYSGQLQTESLTGGQ